MDLRPTSNAAAAAKIGNPEGCFLAGTWRCCSSVTERCGYAPSSRLASRPPENSARIPYFVMGSNKTKSGLGALSLSCREAARLQSEALDTKLCFSKRLGLRLHLLICKWCRRYGKQIRFLHEAAGEHSDNLAQAGPQELSAQARERIKQRLQSEK